MKKYGESTVKRALIIYYNKKYKNFPEKERDKKIASTLKKTIPTSASGIAAGLTKMGYIHGGDLPSDLKGLEKTIDDGSGFTLIYDSFAEGLEPVYFWILDFMRDNYWGTGLEVSKTLDEFQGSVGSGLFGDLGTRASIMQDRAMKLMTTLNQVVRSVINILYDLKEFDQRMEHYKQLKSENKIEQQDANLALKQIWMDRVDVQRGRGSINMLAQQLQFVTIRDAFMAADSEKDVEKMDLNDRVKRILGPRVQEFEAWKKLSGAELERRYNIEKSYLKSQIDSLKLYSQWAKPYLKTAQQLSASDYRTPDLVSIFNNLQLQVSLFGKKSVSPGDIYDTTIFNKNKFKDIELDKKMYSCVEVSMDYRTIPHTMQRTEQGTHYTQGGKVKAVFRAFALDEDEVKAVEDFETYEGLTLIEGMTEESIQQMQEEIDKYMEEEEKVEGLPTKEKEKAIEEALKKAKSPEEAKKLKKDLDEVRKILRKANRRLDPFNEAMEGLKDITEPLKGFWKPSKDKIAEATRQVAKSKAAGSAYIVYLVYKKSHGMMSE
ncbi:MAG: hypothetical protein CMH63_01665 [Nanoarchaeota archaeon]|nr:hypothetical protein [Nanoarchaeota archaeon]